MAFELEAKRMTHQRNETAISSYGLRKSQTGPVGAKTISSVALRKDEENSPKLSHSKSDIAKSS